MFVLLYVKANNSAIQQVKNYDKAETTSKLTGQQCVFVNVT